jgi:hypothetical protein
MSPATNESSSVKDQSLVVIVKNESELLALADTSNSNKNGILLGGVYDIIAAQKGWTSNDATSTNEKYNVSEGLRNTTNNATTTSTTTLVPPPCAFPSTTILASAEFCNTDQFDRPTVGVLHLCLSEDLFFQNEQYAAKTVVHEIGHVLGFNSISMAYLRDGSPRTKRDSDGNVPLSNVTCSGGDESNNTTMNVPLPSEDTIRFTTRRNGIHVAEIVTESVAMIVRSKFFYILGLVLISSFLFF